MSIYECRKVASHRNRRNITLELEYSTGDCEILETVFHVTDPFNNVHCQSLELKLDFIKGKATIYSPLNEKFAFKSKLVDWSSPGCRFVGFYLTPEKPVIAEFHDSDDNVFISCIDEYTYLESLANFHIADSPEFQQAWNEARCRM